jgi:hypothetical protein
MRQRTTYGPIARIGLPQTNQWHVSVDHSGLSQADQSHTCILRLDTAPASPAPAPSGFIALLGRGGRPPRSWLSGDTPNGTFEGVLVGVLVDQTSYFVRDPGVLSGESSSRPYTVGGLGRMVNPKISMSVRVTSSGT